MPTVTAPARSLVRPLETRPAVKDVRASAPAEGSKLGDGRIDANGDVFNWKGTGGTHPAQLVEPASLAEAGRLIAAADRVRIAGNLHSSTNGMMSDGLMLRLTGIKGFSEPVRQPDGSYTVWASGAPTIDELTDYLEGVVLPDGDRGRAPGLTLAWQATQPFITGPGAVANGVHASGLTPPVPQAEGLATYADQIVGMKLFKGNGELYEVPKELLPTARVAMGMLPIAALQWRTVPNFELKSSNQKFEGEAALDQLKAETLRQTLTDHTSSLFTLDLTDGVHLNERLLDVVHSESEAAGLPRKTQYDLSGRVGALLAKLAFGASALAPKALGLLHTFAKLTRHSLMEGPPDRVGTARMMYQQNLNYPVTDESYSIPLENLHTVVAELARVFENERFDFNLPIGIRVLGNSDKTNTGLNSGRDTAVIEIDETTDIANATPTRQNEYAQIRDEIRGIIREYGGNPDVPNGEVRMHPAKDMVEPKDLAAGFPKESWEKLARLIKAIDGKKFLNEWTASYTPLASML